MKGRKTKILVTALISALVTAQAAAQTVNAAAAGVRHNIAYAADCDAVVSGRKRIGCDPDPRIRNEILRHYDFGWPD